MEENRKIIINIALWLLFITLIFRFPFWFKDVINWDESTFILMGKSILDGYLPYTSFWDLKPPLAFINISIILSFFGDSITSIRVGGALYVFLSSLLVYLIVLRIFGRLEAIIASTLCVPMMTLYWSGQATMTEHLAIVPVLLASYLLVKNETVSHKSTAIVGLLISIAALTRLNLAYISVPIGLLIMFNTHNTKLTYKIHTGTIYALSGILPILGIIFIYWLTGNLEILYKSLILAPLSYSSEQSSFWEAFMSMGWQLISPKGFPYLGLKQLVVILAVTGGVIFIYRFFKDIKNRRVYWILSIFTLSILFSILASGGGHAHYLIQLSPFIVIFAAYSLNVIKTNKRLNNFFLVFLGVIFILSMTNGVGRGYKQLGSRLVSNENSHHGKSYWVRKKIEELNMSDYTLYAMSHHIIYYLTDTYPLTPLSTHPSNITKQFLIKSLHGDDATPLNELIKILDTKPTFILKKDSVCYFNNYPDLQDYLNNYLEGYRLYDRNGNLNLFVRKDSLTSMQEGTLNEKY